MKFKVPAAALNGVIGATKNVEAEKVRVAEGKSYFYFTAGAGGEYFYGVRKIEREFPAVEAMITQVEPPTDEIAIDKLMFEAMVKGVSLGLATDDVKVQIEVSGSGTEAAMEISALNSVNRRSHEKSSCGRKMEPASNLSFPVSYKHLLDTMAVFKGDSVVDMQVIQPRSLLLVRDTTEDRQVLTVIPFRTQAAIDAEKKELERKAAEAEAAKAAAAKEKETKAPTESAATAALDVE